MGSPLTETQPKLSGRWDPVLDRARRDVDNTAAIDTPLLCVESHSGWRRRRSVFTMMGWSMHDDGSHRCADGRVVAAAPQSGRRAGLLVPIRAGFLAVVLGERDGSLGEALDLIRCQLGRLEAWIEGMKRWLCRRDRTA